MADEIMLFCELSEFFTECATKECRFWWAAYPLKKKRKREVDKVEERKGREGRVWEREVSRWGDYREVVVIDAAGG